RRLAEAEAAVTAGDALLGLEKAELLAEEAQAVAYWPVIAESLLLKARFESSLERSELADTSLAQALEAAQAAGHARVAASAFVYRVRVAGYQQADFDRGQRYAQYAEAALSHLGQPQELAALLAGHRGAIFFEQGRFPEALEAHVDALELWTEARGPEDPKTGVALTRVGDVLLETGDLKAAAARYEAALEIARRQYGETHPQSARLFSRTGRVLMKQGESTRARGFFEQALAASRATLPPDHPYLATSLSYLAQALVAAGDYEEAMDNYRQALAVLEAAEKPDPRRLSAVLSGLARTSSSTNDYAQAARFYGRALELRKEVYGDGHVLVGEAVFNLGEVAQNQGDFERALSFFRQSLDIWRRAAPDDGFLIAAALTGVAEALLGLGDSAAALPRLEQALGLHPQGREAEFVATTQFALARALVAEGRESVRARELAEGALEGFRGGRALSGEDAREVEQWLETHFAGR
ncbi:MAG: tetratricopeptide repeat protein, partial [Acidobacteriota bacterium]